MNIYLLIIFILMIIGVKIYVKQFNNSYLSKDSTAMIKGIFILFVFYRHVVTYTVSQYAYDFVMIAVDEFLEQLIVTLFLFYSGYGIYESIKKKGRNYVNSLPVNRILKTWVKFFIAVLSFLVLAVFIKEHYDFLRIIKSFTAWNEIGNSNWYVFAILCMYAFTYISFKLFKKDRISIYFNLFLTICFIVFISHFKDEYWFNTIICYNFGMLYSYYREKIEKFLFNNRNYIITLIINVCLFILMHDYSKTNFWTHELYSIIFVIIILLLTMKISINNRILKWLGDNLFWLYILQRIPMILFKKIGLADREYLYIIICFIVTIVLTVIYNYISTKYIDKIFTSKKRDKKIG